MPHPAKGARLWLRPEARDAAGKLVRRAAFVIRDGGRMLATGCGAGEGERARLALASYITETYAAPRRERRLSDIPVADVIAIYLDDKIAGHPDQRRIAKRFARIVQWWGDKSLADVTGASCRAFTKARGTDGGARRDLQDLSAAIGHHHREGHHREAVKVALPRKGRARETWLTRQQVARLIRVCWRMREAQGGVATGRYTMRHVARFLMLAYHTASRPGAVLTASWHAAAGRSWLDLDAGIFYRLRDGGRVTNKRQPPVRLSAPILSACRRWRDKAIGASYAVEFNAAPVRSIKTAFARAVKAAELGAGISPHTIRHTACTHMAQRGVPEWEACGFAGMTPEVYRKHYAHHHPDHMSGAVRALSGRE